MAKYEITYSCGHTGVVNIQGKVKERQGIADYMARKNCADCLAKQRLEESKKLVEENLDLPLLQGSEKQVSWAVRIRNEKLNNLRKLVENAERHPNPEFARTVKEWADKQIQQVSASWWIDNSDIDFSVHITRDNEVMEKLKQIHEQK